MSGPLRRIKRSRPADAGEPHPEGRAAEAEGAATTPATAPAASEETRPDTSEAPTQIVPPAGTGEGAAAAGTSDASAQGAATPEASDTTTGGVATPGNGDTTAQGDATTPEASDTTTGGVATPGTGDTTAQGDATTPGASDTNAQGDATPAAPEPRKQRRWRPFRRRARELPPATLTPAPVLKADPDVPAGVDPAAAPMRPPAGRRGRLRRRLRYLRRARELMLRDLGGLLYEIHRTGGGNVEAHANVVGAKVQRIAGLDAEAHALEAALASPRPEAVVFEPGIGGTCATCGELYGSDARFCANCGTPIGAAPETGPPETHEVVTAPQRRAFWRRAARTEQPAGDDDAAKAATDESAATREQRTDESAAADADAQRDAPKGSDESAAAPRDEPRADEPASSSSGATTDEPASSSGATADEQARSGSAGTDEPPHNPRARAGNGRPDDRNAPGTSPGDPLFSRERS